MIVSWSRPSPACPQFIGCATDAKLVEPTAVMLTSVDLNGRLPNAIVLAACFGLSDTEKRMLRIGAGHLGTRMRFIDVKPEMFHEVDPYGFTDEYPPAVLGRLMLCDAIEVSGARLLTLDSDMIVNSSLEPLFQFDFGHQYFAAVHDPPRLDDPYYFNSGMTLCDVDTYKHYDVARRCLTYIAKHKPHFPDQDALNHVVGDSWWRLDPLWNYFKEPDREITPADYELAKIAHFPGWKPWENSYHPGRGLYARYLLKQRAKMDAADGKAATDDFVANCHEVLLGQVLTSDVVVRDWSGRTVEDVLISVLTSDKFQSEVLPFIEHGRAISSGCFHAQPTLRQRYWAAGLPGLSDDASIAVKQAASWRDLLCSVLSDTTFLENLRLPLDFPVAADDGSIA